MKKLVFQHGSSIHLTEDEGKTLCGHVFVGPKRTVSSDPVRRTKHVKHCKTCFKTKTDYKAPWLTSDPGYSVKDFLRACDRKK